MITIKFNQDITLFLTYPYLHNVLTTLKLRGTNIEEYLSNYSFESPNALYNLIQDKNHLVIYYHQYYIPQDFDILNLQHFEIILKCLEQLYIYQRDFPLLQMDYYPQYNLALYTYSQVWESDFDKFQEAPNQEYTWSNLPKTLKDPNSNMHVREYNPYTHIATVYHYYTL